MPYSLSAGFQTMEEWRADIREVQDYIGLLLPRLLDSSKADFHLPSGPSREITHRLLRIHWETRQKTGLTDALWNEKAWINGRAEAIGLDIYGRVIDAKKFRGAYEDLKDHLVKVDEEKAIRKGKPRFEKLAQAEAIAQLKEQHKGIRIDCEPVGFDPEPVYEEDPGFEAQLGRRARGADTQPSQ